MLMLADSFERLMDKDLILPILAIGGFVVIVLFKTAASVLKSASRERTRREIAAFIAEGSITAEQGERLMKAGGDAEHKC